MGEEENKFSLNFNMVSSSASGFCYSDAATTSTNNALGAMNQIQSTFGSDPAEIYSLTTGMEMIGFDIPPPSSSNIKTTPHSHSILLGSSSSSASKAAAVLFEFYVKPASGFSGGAAESWGEEEDQSHRFVADDS